MSPETTSYERMSRPRKVSLWLQAVFYVGAGINLLVHPGFYLKIVPPGLPSPEWLNLLSGLAEIVLGVFLLGRRTRPYAALGIIALVMAVYPANLWMAF